MSNRSDNFDRANNATSLGSPSDGGSAWVALNGTWGISGNAAYKPSAFGSFHVAYLEAGSATGQVQCTITNTVTNGGPAGRIGTVGNFFFAQHNAGNIKLWRVVGSTFTQIGSTYTGTTALGDVIRLTVDAANAWSVHQNGVLRIGPVTDAAGSTNTKHGLADYSASTRYEDWSFTDTGGGGGSAEVTLGSAAATSAAGTITVSAGATVNLEGASATAAAGTVTASAGTAASITLPSASAAAAAGTVSATAGASITITGAQATAQAGTIVAVTGGGASVTLGSASASAQAGSIGATGGASTTLPSAAATSAAGTITASNASGASVTLGSAAAASAAGSITAQAGASVTLTGAQAVAAAGNIIVGGVALVLYSAAVRTMATGAARTSTAAIRWRQESGRWVAYARKDPHSTIDFSADWSAWLADAATPEPLLSTDVQVAGVTRVAQSLTGSVSTGLLSGGTVGQPASVTFVASTATKTDIRTLHLDIVEQ